MDQRDMFQDNFLCHTMTSKYWVLVIRAVLRIVMVASAVKIKSHHWDSRKFSVSFSHCPQCNAVLQLLRQNTRTESFTFTPLYRHSQLGETFTKFIIMAAGVIYNNYLQFVFDWPIFTELPRFPEKERLRDNLCEHYDMDCKIIKLNAKQTSSCMWITVFYWMIDVLRQ